LPEGATPREREAHRKAEERFLTEGGKPGVSNVPANVDPTDRRLAQLRGDHRNFLRDRNPITSALWLALLRPAKDVIHDAEMTKRYRAAQAGALPPGLEYVAPERASIVEIGIQMAAAGMTGDVSAIEKIAERIEGKTGLRPGDVDPEDKDREKQSELIVSKLVAKLTGDRVKSEAKVIDVEAEVVEPKK
jgi:hypothetical protein